MTNNNITQYSASLSRVLKCRRSSVAINDVILAQGYGINFQVDESEHSHSRSLIRKTFAVEASYELYFGYTNAHYRQPQVVLRRVAGPCDTLDQA